MPFAVIFTLTAASSPQPFSRPSIQRSSAYSTAAGFFPVEAGVARVSITRMTKAGDYAVASFEHGRIEGSHYSGQLLLQRFDFGWQVVDLSASRRFTTADLTAHGITAGTAAALLQGFVPSKFPWGTYHGALCAEDSGDTRDVTAIRKLLLMSVGEAISPVVVDSGYAFARWFGNGGGEDIFLERNGAWTRIAGGGGAFNTKDLVTYHVPPAVASRLMRQQLRCG